MACILSPRLQEAVPSEFNQDILSRRHSWICPGYTKHCDSFILFSDNMKFPVNVIAKKHSARRTSVDVENTNNTLNTIMNSTEIVDTERLAISTTALHSASNPEMICEPQQEQTLEVNNIPDTLSNCADDEGNEDEADDEDDNESKGFRTPEARSRSTSQNYDDSGFCSSASDDKDDELNTGCEKCDNESENTSTRRPRSDSQMTLLEASSLLSSTSDSLERSDSSISNIRQLSVRPSGRNTDNGAPSHPTSVPHRPATRRRRARQDQNNNNVRAVQLHSFFRRSPVHLQDCFQEKGFLTFLACILYTLILASVFAFFGAVVATAKAVIGTEDLNELKNHLHDRRRRRPIGSSGPMQTTS